MEDRLERSLPVFCVSTQLIEAGVDVDFASVIRFLAGLDSIAQAAGRCNREGERDNSQVYVINPHEENIQRIDAILKGISASYATFENFDDLLSPDAMEHYFSSYFKSAKDMSYAVHTDDFRSSLLKLLGSNSDNRKTIKVHAGLKQSFKMAGKYFQAIDAASCGVIVPYGEGSKLITKLSAVDMERNPKLYYRLLKQAQQYSVNMFESAFKELSDAGKLRIIEDSGLTYLDGAYSDEFGIDLNTRNDDLMIT